MSARSESLPIDASRRTSAAFSVDSAPTISVEMPVTCETSSLKVENGTVKVPTGPGFGVTIDAAFVRDAVRVKAN